MTAEDRIGWRGDTVPPRPKPGNRPPVYPTALRQRNIEGQVVARFIVKADGIPVSGATVIIKSDHALFSDAVRTAVPKLRFMPASVNGKAIDDVVTMPFVFALARVPPR